MTYKKIWIGSQEVETKKVAMVDWRTHEKYFITVPADEVGCPIPPKTTSIIDPVKLEKARRETEEMLAMLRRK